MSLGDPTWGDLSRTFLFPDASLWPVDSSPAHVAIVEPPPGGYPKVIVHPERPDGAFAWISDGWYRSPTGDVVPYRTVAEYVLTAQGVAREELMKRVGQLPSTNVYNWILYGGAALVVVVLLFGGRR